MEVFEPLCRHGGVCQVRLIQRIQLRLTSRDPLDLRVETGQRDAGVQQDQAGIHMLDLLFHHAEGLGHMARKPLDIQLVCKPGFLIVHFTTPKSEKGKKQSSTLPKISRSSMQPT